MSTSPVPATRRRRRRSWAALLTGLAGSAVLAVSMNSSLAAFTASITNSVNELTAGTLIMEEKNADGTVTCLSTSGTGNNVTNNAATCSTINKYGGATLKTGQTSTTTVTIKNVGTASAGSFTLAPGTCSQSGAVTGSATDLCTKLGIVITQTVGTTTTTITPASSTLASIAAGSPLSLSAPVNPGDTISFSFAVTVPSSLGNTYQGLTGSQPLVWTFTA